MDCSTAAGATTGGGPTNRPPKRVLSARLFDLLKASAERHGGIGADAFRVGDGEHPCCVVGHLAHALTGMCDPLAGAWEIQSRDWKRIVGTTQPAHELLQVLGGGDPSAVYRVNDAAVRAINGDWYGTPRPVDFWDWARKLNVRRAREIAAPEYDALQAAAERFGGVGGVSLYCGKEPNCLIGLAHYTGKIPNAPTSASVPDNVYRAFEKVTGSLFGGLYWPASDVAVTRINRRLGAADHRARVPFKLWAEELDVRRVIVLPPELYDGIERLAGQYGGIGPDTLWEAVDGGRAPRCVLGMAYHLNEGEPTSDAGLSPMEEVLMRAFNTDWWAVGQANDRAVRAINKRLGRGPQERVLFVDWAVELNIVRGDEAAVSPAGVMEVEA